MRTAYSSAIARAVVRELNTLGFGYAGRASSQLGGRLQALGRDRSIRSFCLEMSIPPNYELERSVMGLVERAVGAASAREFCVNQSCTVPHRGAFVATGAPANRLMQLMLRISV